MFGFGTPSTGIIGSLQDVSQQYNQQLGMQQAAQYQDPKHQIMAGLRQVPKDKRGDVLDAIVRELNQEELEYDLEKEFKALSTENKITALKNLKEWNE